MNKERTLVSTGHLKEYLSRMARIPFESSFGDFMAARWSFDKNIVDAVFKVMADLWRSSLDSTVVSEIDRAVSAGDGRGRVDGYDWFKYEHEDVKALIVDTGSSWFVLDYETRDSVSPHMVEYIREMISDL